MRDFGGQGASMTSRLAAAVLILATAVVTFAPAALAQNPERYKIRLSTVPMDGGMRATGAGAGTASAVLTGSKLAINGTFDRMLSPATTARLHNGLARGVRGPAVGDLTVSKAMNGTISGSIDLTPEQVQGLHKGQLYIQ